MEVINPMDRPCCANCHCLIIENVVDEDFNSQLQFTVSCDCPHSDGRPFKKWAGMDVPLRLALNDSHITEVSALLDFVCDSWEGRGEPLNLDR